MSKWINKPVEIAVAFDGDEVKATASRLLVSDMASLVGKKFDLNTTEGQIGITQVGADVLPRYLKTFDGLTDAEGAPIPLDVYLSNINEFYFAPLTASLLMALIAESSIKAQEKN